MKIKPGQEFAFLENTDLTDRQIAKTRITYELNADKYVLNYERRWGALEEARLFTLDPFLKLFKEVKKEEKILFIGCGSGRDMEEAHNQGFSCVGIDISSHMINIGKIMGINQPMLQMDLENLNFPDESFGGIYCETALAHVKKTNLKKVLSDFNKMLTKKGVMLLSFRKGDGRVYFTDDKVDGKRYYNTVCEEVGDSYIKAAGFGIISKSTHQVGTKPPYYNLLTVKNK